MSVTTGPNLGLIINALTGDSFPIDFRTLLRALDVLLQSAVIDQVHTAPPGSPANGDRYIVAASPTGAWAGQAKSIAVWTTDNPGTPGGLWEFYAPKPGWDVWSLADASLYVYTGSAWIAAGGGGGGGMSNPMTTLGDLITGGASGTPGRLAIGSSGQVLSVVSGAPGWTTPGGGGGGPSVNDQTASYTAVLGDGNNVVTMSNASANNFTVPPNSSVAFPIGTTLTVLQKGAGQTALVAGAGVTINNPSSLTARAQWSTISVTQILANTWVAAGDLT